MYFGSPLIKHRYLIVQLIKRDVLLRYRGALLGVMWLFLHPLLMLAVFAFVFGEVFRSRWPQQSEQDVPFWVLLYSGLIAFNIFAESVSRAPGAVRGQPNLVKKVVFPVQILPLVPIGTSLIHGIFNLAILAGVLAYLDQLHAQLLLYPVMLLPLLLLSLGLSWFISAWGVFLKDLNQVVPPFVQMMMFLSPLFYPASAVPEGIRQLYEHNPLGAVIEGCRAAALGRDIDWLGWGVALAVGAAAAVGGYAFFRQSRGEFADVL